MVQESRQDAAVLVDEGSVASRGLAVLLRVKECEQLGDTVGEPGFHRCVLGAWRRGVILTNIFKFKYH